MVVKVLVAEEDLDIHELVSDIIEINFKNVQIERAHDFESMLKKLQDLPDGYDLVLINQNIRGKKSISEVVDIIKSFNASLPKRIVLLAESTTVIDETDIPEKIPVIRRPFSLDTFGQIVQNVYAR